MAQLELPFDEPEGLGEAPPLWTPRDIWVRLNQRILESLKEDHRFERKSGQKPQFDDLATYFSTFANTPDGGLVVFGVENDGAITGCVRLSVEADVLQAAFDSKKIKPRTQSFATQAHPFGNLLLEYVGKDSN